MTSRRSRRTDSSHKRWPSSPPSLLFNGDGGHSAATALVAPPQALEMDKNYVGGRAGGTSTRGRSPPRGDSMYRETHQRGMSRPHGWLEQQQKQQQIADTGNVDDDYPDIPTDDFNKYMAALVNGIRSDGAELASTAREAVASTFHVVVRPLEAVARLAAPFLQQQQPIASRETAQRGQAQLDDALFFRMPGAHRGRTQASPYTAPAVDASNVSNGEAVNGFGALGSINGNSPPRRSHSPLARSVSLSRGAVMNKDGKGWQKLGAVKLAISPPDSRRQDRRRRVSCSPRPSRAGDTSSRDCSPTPSPRTGPGGGCRNRRISVSTSPSRDNGVGVSGINSPILGDSNGKNGEHSSVCNSGVHTNVSLGLFGRKFFLGSQKSCERGGTDDNKVVGKDGRSERGCTGRRGRRDSISPCRPVVDGSRIDLRALDRVKGRMPDRPQAYPCTDGSIVILGRERMLSVRPETADTRDTPGGAAGRCVGDKPGSGGRRLTPASGVVTWVVRYGQVESCCVNVSAGQEAQRSVGDVVVEVTTRPAKGSAPGTQPSKRSFCLTNPSDCLELLRSIQAHWQPPSSPSDSGKRSSTAPVALSKGGAQAASVGTVASRGSSSRADATGNEGDRDAFETPRKRRERSPEREHNLFVLSPSSEVAAKREVQSPGDGGENGGENYDALTEMSPFSGVKKGVIVIESPAKVLRDQLREKHEEHEKDLKEHLENKERASKASLARRRNRRRSISQGPEAVRRLSCSPVAVPRPSASASHGGKDGGKRRGSQGSESECGDDVNGSSEAVKDSANDGVSSVEVYTKMLKNGVPEGAVRQKMKKDGREDAVSIDAVFSVSSTASAPGLALSLPPPLDMGPPLARPAASSCSESDAPGIDPAFVVYSKMRKNKVPEGAIRQKMLINSMPQASIDAFFKGSTPIAGGGDTGTTSTLRLIAPAPPLNGHRLLAVGARPGGLPPPPPPLPSPKIPGGGVGVVGVGSATLTGSGGGNLRLPPPLPCSPLGSCKEKRGFFCKGGSACVTPPDTPSRRRTSVPLMNLHWDVLPPAAIEKTVWGRAKAKGKGEEKSDLVLESVDDDEVEELEKLFPKKAAAMMSPRATPRGFGESGADTPGGRGLPSVGSKGSGAFFGDGFQAVAVGGRVKKVQLLDVGRGNNVAIGLRSFKLAGGVTELARVIGRLDPKGMLTTEDLQRLEACLPTEPELKTVLEYDGPVEALGPAEAFFLALAPTPRPDSKVSVLLFSLQLASIADVADARLKTLRSACQEITTSDRLVRVLDRVLLIGNLLNEGTYKGNACGFRLSSLLKLSHTKSHADKKTTVLHYMVRSLAAKQKVAMAAATSAVAPVKDEAMRPASANIDADAYSAVPPALSPSSDAGDTQQLPPPLLSPASSATSDTDNSVPEPPSTTLSKATITSENTPRHYRRMSSSTISMASESPPSPANSVTTVKPWGAPPRPFSSTAGTPWPRGAPPGCVRAVSSSALSGQSHRRVTVGDGAGATRRGAATSVSPRGRGNVGAAGGRAWGSGGITPSRLGGGRNRLSRGGLGERFATAGRGAEKMRVEVLDLEEELGHLRAASKIPISEILVDVRQAKRGLQQARDELELVLSEIEKTPARGKRDGQKTPESGNVVDNLDSVCGGGAGKESKNNHDVNAEAGIRKLTGFVESAKARLATIEASANQCSALCKGLGEYFGEDVKDAGAQSSAHILKTLVQFLDLLAQAKKAEGLA